MAKLIALLVAPTTGAHLEAGAKTMLLESRLVPEEKIVFSWIQVALQVQLMTLGQPAVMVHTQSLDERAQISGTMAFVQPRRHSYVASVPRLVVRPGHEDTGTWPMNSHSLRRSTTVSSLGET
jgi:hypothetical protein